MLASIFLMSKTIFERIFGSYNDKQVKKLRKEVPKVRQFQKKYEAMSEEALKQVFVDWKAEFSENKEKLDEKIYEVFGAIIAASKKLIGLKYEVREKEEEWIFEHYDVQIIGGLVLHRGNVAEMRTGEGKTLSSTLPIIANALCGRGVHAVTVNDYLATRDAEWMTPLYDFCGLSVGIITNGVPPQDRKAAYAADITYGTNNEFGFDYLRDNMAQSIDGQVQRGLFFAIVDEVDSILIDEARTPLIISAPADESTQKYQQYAQLIPNLTENEDYNVELRTKTVTLSEKGIAKMEKLLGIENIYTEAGFDEVHHIENALKANVIFEKEKDYIVADGKVIIVDEFTGRLMAGRRFSNGLHQALEAKEKVEIQRESKTLATVTFQNFFRLYDKLSGMTGTAETEAEEFAKIYKLDTVVIPTNKPIARKDLKDKIFKNTKGKFLALAADIKQFNEKGQPVLVGTASIERSEIISSLLTREGVKHEVLNAKYHEREAEIVAKAGQIGSVTIATNMAGRGTDIKISEEVKNLGGLAILGTERHESRRIDNQLRGRAGRQGDPGQSQFYVAMTDELMRRFGGEKLAGLMDKLGLPETEAIQSGQMSRQVESAQKKIEGYHFDARKHVVQYDDVMNIHREKMYARRRKLLGSENILEDVDEMIVRTVNYLVETYAADGMPIEQKDHKELLETLKTIHSASAIPQTEAEIEDWSEEKLKKTFIEAIKGEWEDKKAELPEEQIDKVARYVVLRTIDELWIEHLNAMTSLRDRVALSGYAQRDPVTEYKREGYDLFKRLLLNISRRGLQNLFRVQVATKPAENTPKDNPYAKGSTNQQEIEENLQNTGEMDQKQIQKNPYAGASTGQRKAPTLSRKARRQMERKKGK